MVVTGYDVGVAHPGGFAELARIPADWVMPLPAGLTTKEAMALGTAGFTAALSVDALECGNGSDRTQHPVELLGEDWLEHGDWGIESGTQSPQAPGLKGKGTS